MACSVEGGERCARVWLAESTLSCFVRSSAVAIVVTVVRASCVAAFAAGDFVQRIGIVVRCCGRVCVPWKRSSRKSRLFVVGVTIAVVIMVPILFVMT